MLFVSVTDNTYINNIQCVKNMWNRSFHLFKKADNISSRSQQLQLPAHVAQCHWCVSMAFEVH
jgi:hypothetical protein